MGLASVSSLQLTLRSRHLETDHLAPVIADPVQGVSAVLDCGDVVLNLPISFVLINTVFMAWRSVLRNLLLVGSLWIGVLMLMMAWLASDLVFLVRNLVVRGVRQVTLCRGLVTREEVADTGDVGEQLGLRLAHQSQQEQSD